MSPLYGGCGILNRGRYIHSPYFHTAKRLRYKGCSMVLNVAAVGVCLPQKKRPVAAVSLLFPYGKLRRFDDGIENSAAEQKERSGITGDKFFLCCNMVAIKGAG